MTEECINAWEGHSIQVNNCVWYNTLKRMGNSMYTQEAVLAGNETTYSQAESGDVYILAVFTCYVSWIEIFITNSTCSTEYRHNWRGMPSQQRKKHPLKFGATLSVSGYMETCPFAPNIPEGWFHWSLHLFLIHLDYLILRRRILQAYHFYFVRYGQPGLSTTDFHIPGRRYLVSNYATLFRWEFVASPSWGQQAPAQVLWLRYRCKFEISVVDPSK